MTGTTNFFVTKNIYNDEHEKTRAPINNQLIIHQEKDKAHEFSQTVFIVLLAIITSFIALYIVLKCAVNAILNRKMHQHNSNPAAAIAAQPTQAVFEP